MFDFGGTLFSYTAFQRQNAGLIAEAAKRLDVQVGMRDVVRAWRAASRDSFSAYADRPFYLYRDLFRDTFRGFAGKVGAEASTDYLDWFHEAQRRVIVEQFELRPGCVEVLTRLREAGLHVSIVSNIDDDYLEPMLQRAGLGPYLDAWTSSEGAGSCKPDAAIFHHALAKSGAAPEETVFVGDSREQDILGARALGMQTVLIHEDGADPPATGVGPAGEPHHVIRSLPELMDVLPLE